MVACEDEYEDEKRGWHAYGVEHGHRHSQAQRASWTTTGAGVDMAAPRMKSPAVIGFDDWG